MDCYSKWVIPRVVSLMRYFQPITEPRLKHWSLVGRKSKSKRNTFDKIPFSQCFHHYVKVLLIIIVLKEQYYLHIVTFLYQLIVIALLTCHMAQVWKCKTQIFSSTWLFFIESASLTANPNVSLFCRLKDIWSPPQLWNTKSGF